MKIDIRKYGIDRILTPLLEDLAQLANPAGVIFNPRGRMEYIPLSYLDGALAETNPIFSEDPTALQIRLYYDKCHLNYKLHSILKNALLLF